MPPYCVTSEKQNSSWHSQGSSDITDKSTMGCNSSTARIFVFDQRTMKKRNCIDRLIMHNNMQVPSCPIVMVQDWLIEYLVFYVPLKNISLIWRRHHDQWRAAKFRPILGA
jgi:hypothetical protein